MSCATCHNPALGWTAGGALTLSVWVKPAVLGPNQVIFSRREATGQGDGAKWQSSIHAVAWQGGPPRRLRDGYAVDAWRDPDKGQVWIYALTTLRNGIGANPEGYRLFRFRADDPGQPGAADRDLSRA